MPENSRSQLIILRNTRWVVRFSVLEVFRDAYNAAVKAINYYVKISFMNFHPGTPSRLNTFLSSLYGRTISIVSRDMFRSLSHSCCPSYVFVSDLVFACHSVHTIHHSILISFTSIRFSCRSIAAHGSGSSMSDFFFFLM